MILDTYYEDELSTDDYYHVKEEYYSDYDSKFYDDYTEITNFCDINYNIFPFNYNIIGYEDLEYLIEKQFSVFNEKFLCNINNGDNLIVDVLKKPDCIFNYIKKYKNNYIFIYIFKVLYIISLIHNNSSIFVILVLINCISLQIDFKDNLLYFNKSAFNLCLEEQIYDLFYINPMIRKYIKYNPKPI